MPCECCSVAREHPGVRQYSLGCQFCCARLIANLADGHIRPDELVERRRAALRRWVEYGAQPWARRVHTEAEIRDLHKRKVFLEPPPKVAAQPAWRRG